MTPEPKNPLNDLTIYTYHIALFMGKSQTQLEEYISSFDWTKGTHRSSAEGFCLLNSVADPFQSVQELRIEQMAPCISSEFKTTPFSMVTMRVVEPGNCMFVSKIAKLMQSEEVNTTALGDACWAVKIKFVGRTPDGEIVDDFNDIDPLYLTMTNCAGVTNQAGSTYEMQFIMNDTFGVGELEQHSASIRVGSVRNAINFKALTIGEALDNLQFELQYAYEEDKKSKVEFKDMRPIRYVIQTSSDEIREMKLDGVNRDYADPKNPSFFIFESNKPIQHCIQEILYRSNQFTRYISANPEVWSTPYHVNGKMSIIESRIDMLDDEAVVTFNVGVYEGAADREGTSQGNTNHFLYEFDFYFAEDYNVDVMQFDITFENSFLLYLTTDNRDTVDNIHNTSDKMAGNAGEAVITTGERIENQGKDLPATETAEGTRGDIFMPAPVPEVVRRGFPGASQEGSAARTQALLSMAKFTSLDAIQKDLRLRGHYGLLQKCLNGLGAEQGIWVKVHVKTRDEETGQVDNYFYDSEYQLMSITHRFMEGKFEQDLSLMMMNFTDLDSIGA